MCIGYIWFKTPYQSGGEMTEKNMRFQGKNKNLDTLSNEIQQKLIVDGYDVQANSSDKGITIQAKKAGVLRDIIAADRAFTIQINGEPNDFTVRIGIGKFIQNLAVTAAEAVLLSELFLAVDVPEMLWTKHVENGIAQNINNIIAQGESTTVTKAKRGRPGRRIRSKTVEEPEVA
jgi:hypothetical protein